MSSYDSGDEYDDLEYAFLGEDGYPYFGVKKEARVLIYKQAPITLLDNSGETMIKIRAWFRAYQANKAASTKAKVDKFLESSLIGSETVYGLVQGSMKDDKGG